MTHLLMLFSYQCLGATTTQGTRDLSSAILYILNHRVFTSHYSINAIRRVLPMSVSRPHNASSPRRDSQSYRLYQTRFHVLLELIHTSSKKQPFHPRFHTHPSNQSVRILRSCALYKCRIEKSCKHAKIVRHRRVAANFRAHIALLGVIAAL